MRCRSQPAALVLGKEGTGPGAAAHQPSHFSQSATMSRHWPAFQNHRAPSRYRLAMSGRVLRSPRLDVPLKALTSLSRYSCAAERSREELVGPQSEQRKPKHHGGSKTPVADQAHEASDQENQNQQTCEVVGGARLRRPPQANKAPRRKEPVFVAVAWSDAEERTSIGLLIDSLPAQEAHSCPPDRSAVLRSSWKRLICRKFFGRSGRI